MHVVSVPFETVFQALSDPTRLRVIRLMVESKEEACSCELSDALLEPEYKLSRHMKILRQAGLVSTEKQGRWVYHRLVVANSALKALFRAVEQIPLDKPLEADLARFKKRMKLRENGRCCVGPIAQTDATTGGKRK